MGATGAASAALLLYTARGFLGTAGFLIALLLSTLALGLWVGEADGSARRRSIYVVVSYVAAALFAGVFWTDKTLSKSAFGGALAAFIFLAQPAYATGLAYRSLGRSSGVAAFLGGAAGVLSAALILIPRLHPSVIFVLAAAVLLVAALAQTRQIPQSMSTTDFSLTGKTAIVTGVSDRGQVGFAIARALREAGARVCITSRHEDVSELAQEVDAFGVQCDLTNDDDVARLIVSAREHLGKLDILVNVAGGLTVIKPLAETSHQEWDGEIQRNADTAFLLSKAALPLLRETRGSIINFASPAGARAVAQLGAYSAGKASVIALTRAMAIEEKDNGVRVNAIAPGMIDTAQNRASADENAKFVSREEIANVVQFLASDAAKAVTGETIEVLGEGIQ